MPVVGLVHLMGQRMVCVTVTTNAPLPENGETVITWCCPSNPGFDNECRQIKHVCPTFRTVSLQHKLTRKQYSKQREYQTLLLKM